MIILCSYFYFNIEWSQLLKDYASLAGAIIGVFGSFFVAYTTFQRQAKSEKKKESKRLKEKRNFVLQQANALLKNSQYQIDSIDSLIKQLQETGLHDSLFEKKLSYSINLENILSIERFELYKLFVEDLEIDNKIYYYTNLIGAISFLKVSLEDSVKNHSAIVNQYNILFPEWIAKFGALKNAITEISRELDKTKPVPPTFGTDIVKTYLFYHKKLEEEKRKKTVISVGKELLPALMLVCQKYMNAKFLSMLQDVDEVFNNMTKHTNTLILNLSRSNKLVKSQRLRLCLVIKYYESNS